MGADPDQDEKLRPDRAAPVGRVVGLLARGRIGVGEQRQMGGIAQRVERRLRPVDDEHRPRTPQHDHLLAGLDLAEVDVDRPGGGLGRRVGVHLVDQRPQRRRRADSADRGGGR